jgi:hypothetical protein
MAVDLVLADREVPVDPVAREVLTAVGLAAALAVLMAAADLLAAAWADRAGAVPAVADSAAVLVAEVDLVADPAAAEEDLADPVDAAAIACGGLLATSRPSEIVPIAAVASGVEC